MQKSVIFVNKNLKDEKYRKVRDYCHYPREYRGARHSLCNLGDKVPKKVLQFFIRDQTMTTILSLKN